MVLQCLRQYLHWQKSEKSPVLQKTSMAAAGSLTLLHGIAMVLLPLAAISTLAAPTVSSPPVECIRPSKPQFVAWEIAPM
jgi:hypothetical protein